MKILIVIIFINLLTFISNPVYAHMVDYEIREGKAAIIKVEYSDGEPMSYAKVKIFSPVNEKIEYQNGRTDKNGCFTFLPDMEGTWKIIINDEMGHGVVEKIEIIKPMTVKPVRRGLTRLQKIIVFICVIFGITGITCCFKAKKEKHKKGET